MPDDCILWDGPVMSTGYGRDGTRLAHRVAYEKSVGPICRGFQVHHRCGQKLCVNPDHLVQLTPQAHNAAHGFRNVWGAERRRAVTHCPQGHEYTPENTLTKRGSRHCRKCENKRSREYYWKNVDRLRARMRERAKERYWERNA